MILKVSDSLSRDISAKCQKIKPYFQNETDEFMARDNDFSNIVENTKRILERNLFIVVRNIGFNRERNIFEAFVKQFGKYYGEVEYTDIKLDCSYTGCNYNRIEFHNDDAIDIDTQPVYGFIQVIKEDPLKITKNHIVRIDDIVEYLEVFDPKLLEKLFTHKVPMLAQGINYIKNDNKEIIVKEPILYELNNKILVRFDSTRIKYHYWNKNIQQPLIEKKLIFDFLQVAQKVQHELYLEKGDILIHNNKRTVHDRGNCSMELLEDGTFNTREIFVSFVR